MAQQLIKQGEEDTPELRGDIAFQFFVSGVGFWRNRGYVELRGERIPWDQEMEKSYQELLKHYNERYKR